MAEHRLGKRPFTPGIDTSGTFPVEYRFSGAPGGSRSLFVVFANFSAPDQFGWTNGVFDRLDSNVLWIRDRFAGECAYYLCKDMDFALAESVNAVIAKVLKALDLTPADCTLWGSSKGGSAALYFGLAHGYRNVVALAPQMAIGTYVRTVHPRVARAMTGEDADGARTAALDALLPGLARSAHRSGTSIYLVSALQDEQYATQIEPYLDVFEAREGFNFILSDSPLIEDHRQVSGRNVPTLMGIASMLAEGITPRFGSVRNGYEQPHRDTSPIERFLAGTPAVRPSFAAPVIRTPGPGATVPPAAGVHFAGTASERSVRVSLWSEGRFLASPQVAADGSWECHAEPGLPAGTHRVRAFAVDATGYQSLRAETDLTVAG
ncbi:hypothetical protein ACFVHW_01305 [Streptomyces sp. NPDC127110]|uniref:hypothetical protein n=1 Tax=Streptomyces sp. NPDC127110 TaxID=3345362 RepID=UPI003627D850